MRHDPLTPEATGSARGVGGVFLPLQELISHPGSAAEATPLGPHSSLNLSDQASSVALGVSSESRSLVSGGG